MGFFLGGRDKTIRRSSDAISRCSSGYSGRSRIWLQEQSAGQPGCVGQENENSWFSRVFLKTFVVVSLVQAILILFITTTEISVGGIALYYFYILPFILSSALLFPRPPGTKTEVSIFLMAAGPAVIYSLLAALGYLLVQTIKGQLRGGTEKESQ